MKVTIDFERPPMRAVYRFEWETDEPMESVRASAMAAAALQFDERCLVRILSVGMTRYMRPTGQPIETDAYDPG